MVAPGTDQKLFVDDVVTALTGTVDAGTDVRGAVQDQMKRATEEFDVRTAEAFARALLEALCQEPIDPRRLEALLILGLAHPTILDAHRISLRREGERLATLLTNQGEPERARSLLDVISAALDAPAQPEAPAPDAKPAAGAGTGQDARTSAERETTQRVEALLRRADDLAGRGRSAEAIRCLQGVVALDQGRRDVARMIRDLRWQGEQRRAKRKRRARFAAITLTCAGLVAALVWRETNVAELQRAIPAAPEGDVAAKRARLRALDELIARERVWTGLPAALSERTRLERAITRFDAQAAAAAEAARAQAQERLQTADALRSRGLARVRNGEFAGALADLRQALEMGGPGWDQRAAVEANAQAIAQWIEKESKQKGPGR